jgi:hypothetical protein
MTIQESMTSSRPSPKPFLWIILAAAAVFFSSQAKKNEAMIASGQTQIEGQPVTYQALTKRRIYFGHQSVGADIVKGIKEITGEEYATRLRVVEAEGPAAFGQPVFAHSYIGENGNPDLKIDRFETIIRSGVGNRADIAMFKLCYIDIVAGTDVPKIFTHYRETLSRLEKTYPHVKFVHITVPLTTLQTGPKAWTKRALGRSAGGYEENVARSAYNELLRKEYAGREPIFDLAKMEATTPDGSISSFTANGRQVDMLTPAYTTDGGHLNELGRRRIARELLRFLDTLK